MDVFADGGRIDVDMNNLGLRTELGDLSRDAIVESGADGDHKIGIMDGHVRGVRAVHAHHAEREIVRGGESPEGHQRHVHRNLREVCELHQLFMCIREDRPAADVNDRLLGLVDRLDRLLDLPLIAFVRRVVSADGDTLRIAEIAFVHGDILGNVHEHRPRATAHGDVKGFLDGLRKVVHILDQEVVLRARTANADVIRLLEGVIPDELSGHLAGEYDDRHRVHVGIHKRRHDVRHAGARGD